MTTSDLMVDMVSFLRQFERGVPGDAIHSLRASSALGDLKFDFLMSKAEEMGFLEFDNHLYSLTSKGVSASQNLSNELASPDLDTETDDYIFPESSTVFELTNSQVLNDLLVRVSELENSSIGPKYVGKAAKFLKLVHQALEQPELELERINSVYCTRLLHMVSVLDTGDDSQRIQASIEILKLIFAII